MPIGCPSCCVCHYDGPEERPSTGICSQAAPMSLVMPQQDQLGPSVPPAAKPQQLTEGLCGSAVTTPHPTPAAPNSGEELDFGRRNPRGALPQQ